MAIHEEVEKMRKKRSNKFNTSDKTTNISITNSYLILKNAVALALFLMLIPLAYAGDVIVENGRIDVDNKLYVTASGDVGVGTIIPTEKLEVIGKVKGTELCIASDCRNSWPAGSGLPSGTAGQTLRHDGINWVSSSLLTNSGNDNIEIQRNEEVYLNLRNTGASGRQWALVSAGTGGIGAGKFSIYDKTGEVSRLVIDSSGNVGIGTTSPDAKLHVIGSVCAEASDTGCAPTSGDVRGTRLCIGTDCRNAWPSGGATLTGSGSTNYVSKWTGASSLGNSIIYDNGNVGIGTTNPQAGLHIDTGSTPLRFRRSGGGGSADFSINNVMTGDDSDVMIIPVPDSDKSGGIALYADPGVGTYSFAMGIDKNGKVGIGTSSPSAKLTVAGSLSLGSGSAQTGKALCWMADKTIGYCSSGVGLAGGCTCNAIN